MPMQTHVQRAQDGDLIQRRVRLRIPLNRVWRAIADPNEFGSWFGMKIDGQFLQGAKAKGTIVPTKVDAETAKQQREYEGLPIELEIERVEPERLFAFRWHPFAVERGTDYSSEPTTLVTFELEESDGEVLLTVTESGFDRLAPERRAKAFAANSAGWAKQMELVRKYLSESS